MVLALHAMCAGLPDLATENLLRKRFKTSRKFEEVFYVQVKGNGTPTVHGHHESIFNY